MKRPFLSYRPRHPRLARLGALILGLLVIVEASLWFIAQSHVQSAANNVLPGARIHTRVGGWPIAANLALDQLGRVTMSADDITIASHGRDLHVTSLHATATGIHGVRSGGRLRVDNVSGTVRLTWAELSNQAGANLSSTEDHTVTVHGTVPVFGEHLPGELTGEVALDIDAQQLRILNPAGTIDGVTVPSDILSGLIMRLSSRFPLPTLPGLSWTDVQVDAEGITLSFVGSDLVFNR